MYNPRQLFVFVRFFIFFSFLQCSISHDLDSKYFMLGQSQGSASSVTESEANSQTSCQRISTNGIGPASYNSREATPCFKRSPCLYFKESRHVESEEEEEEEEAVYGGEGGVHSDWLDRPRRRPNTQRGAYGKEAFFKSQEKSNFAAKNLRSPSPPLSPPPHPSPAASRVNKLWEPTWTDRLKVDLLKSYDKYSRPTEHQNVTTVTLSLILLHVSLDYSKSEMALNCWLPMSWLDEKLKWNKSDYNEIASINIPQHEIWLPDILAYNSAHGNIIDYYGQTSTIVKSDGSVFWVPPSRFTVFCALDLTYWPYDQQTCQLRLGSWSYDGNSIDVQVDKTKSSIDDLEASEWSVIDVSQKRMVQYYNHCPDPYVEIVFTYTIKKESPAFFCTTILPAIVTMLLTLLVFYLSPNAIEKLILNGLCAIISILFLIFFSQKLPIMVHHTPIIVVFYSTVSCLTCLSFAVFIAMDSFTSRSRPVPKFFCSIIKSKFIIDFFHIQNYPPTNNSKAAPVPENQPWIQGQQCHQSSPMKYQYGARISTLTLSDYPPSNGGGNGFKPTTPIIATGCNFSPAASTHNQWQVLAILLHKLLFVVHILVYTLILIKCCFY